MTKGNLEWEEFIWLTVTGRIVFVLAEKCGSKPQAGVVAEGEKMRAHVFKCKHKAEKMNQKQCEALNPKAYPQ